MPRKPVQLTAAGLAGPAKPARGQRHATPTGSSGNRLRGRQHAVADSTLPAFALPPFATIMPAMLVMTWSSLIVDALRRINVATRECFVTFLDVQIDLARGMGTLNLGQVTRQPGADPIETGLVTDRRRMAVVINFPNRRTLWGHG
jgi:hypothetical protein